jgi:hypothetical protein
MMIRVIHAIAVGFVAGLICLALAAILPAMNVEVITSIGAFLGQWAWPIAIAVGLLDFAAGGIGPRFGGSA